MSKASPWPKSPNSPARSPTDAVCDLLVAEENAVTMVVFYGSEEDVKEIMRSEYMTLCSDGIVGGKPHPRVYGTCARFLGKYVREEKSHFSPGN